MDSCGGKGLTEKVALAKREEARTIDLGDFVEIDYKAMLEDGTVFDTTIQNVAKDSGIFDGEKKYGPMLLIIGSNWLLSGLEKKLVGLKEGETKKITLPPKEAFGERDPGKVKTYMLRRFTKRNINPSPGMKIQMEGSVGTVKAVSGGRVIVDFNSPQAGHTVTFEVMVKKVLEEEVDKVKALFKKVFGRNPAKVSLKKKTIELEIPNEFLFSKDLTDAKISFFALIDKYIPEYKKVKFIEIYEKKAEKEK